MDPIRVLVVDDEPGMRAGISRVLTDTKLHLYDLDKEVTFSVSTLESAEEVLPFLEVSKVDILLLDHKLPGMSGLDLLDVLSERKVDILTIMITAYASIDTAIAATRRGAHDFLAKPFTPHEVRGTVRKAARHFVLREQARKLAEEKKRLRFEFISVLAHELKAPLGAIEGYLNIIQAKTLGDELEPYEHFVDRSLARIQGMRGLIFDLLDLTRIESGQKQRNLIPTDIAEVMRSSIETIETSAAERQLDLQINIPDELILKLDAGEQEIIFNNLLTNAVKYNRDGGKVTVELCAEDEGYRLIVSDTGIGMTEAECAKIFDEFVRIKNANTRKISGSGLGLSTLKKLVRLNNGEISVASQPDVGTTFTLRIPSYSGE